MKIWSFLITCPHISPFIADLICKKGYVFLCKIKKPLVTECVRWYKSSFICQTKVLNSERHIQKGDKEKTHESWTATQCNHNSLSLPENNDRVRSMIKRKIGSKVKVAKKERPRVTHQEVFADVVQLPLQQTTNFVP